MMMMMSGSSRPEMHESGWANPPEDRPPERSSKRRRTASSGDDGNQETGLMRDGDSPDLPRFVGSGSGIHFVRTVYDILSRNNGQPTRVHSQVVPGEDDQLDGAREPDAGPGAGAPTPGANFFWHDEEIVHTGDPGRSNVTFDALVAWTKSYFEIWHPSFPFLHGPEVLDILETVANRGIQRVSGQESSIVRALISISLADARQLPGSRVPGARSAPPVPSDLTFLSLDHVASCLLFVLGSPASLRNMQAALCVELFLVSMLKFNMASRLGGTVARMAYHLGLHRCPQRYLNFSPHEVSMRKRIWWSFYCLERLVCQVLGLPLDVQDDDVDVCFPTTETHQRAADVDVPYSLEGG